VLLEELHQRTIFDLADEIIRDSESIFVSLTTLLTLNQLGASGDACRLVVLHGIRVASKHRVVVDCWLRPIRGALRLLGQVRLRADFLIL
jgi:hypothetical protein